MNDGISKLVNSARIELSDAVQDLTADLEHDNLDGESLHLAKSLKARFREPLLLLDECEDALKD